MKVSALTDPLTGERILAVVPGFTTPPDVWYKRLNLFTGRSLSDLALKAEQNNHNGYLALLGQLRSAGVVSGLQVVAEQPPTANKLIQISAGQGLSLSGEDVWLPRPLQVSLNGLPVFWDGALGASLNDFLASATAPDLRTFILLLQPVTLLEADSANANRCTDWDNSARAYEDEQLIDGVRLVLYAWDSGIEPGAGDVALRWRNRLADEIFNQQAAQSPLPWETQGVPIALVALSEDRLQIEFVDGFAVVRQGGRPRARTPLVPNSGNAFLWQARVQQFAEQLAEIEPQGQTLAEQQTWVRETVVPRFRYLPPVGLLPKAGLSPRAPRESQNFFFPANYAWQVAPIPLEQLELLLQDSASLAPFDLDQADQVQVWVPVPQAWFEPNLLQVEPVSPLFQQRIEEFQIRRAEWLARRVWLRERVGAIAQAITGKEPTFPEPDPGQLEDPEEGEAPALDPPEVDYQTELRNEVRVVLPIQTLREQLIGQTPLDNDAVTVANWSASTQIPVALRNKISFNPQTKLLTVKGVLLAEERDQLLNLSPNDRVAIGDLFDRSQDNRDLEKLDQQGLEEFITFLEGKVAQADDTVEFGFLQARTDMYRIRQQVLGLEDASRLATSSTLADIATRESAYATQKDLSAYFEAAKGRPVTRSTRTTRDVAGAARAEASEEAAAFRRRERAIGFQNMSAATTGFDVGNVAAARPAIDLGIPIEEFRQLDFQVQPTVTESRQFTVEALKDASLFQAQFVADDVIEQSPIVGRIPDTVIVGERLQQPAAVETRDFSLVGRKTVVDNFARLGLFKDLPVPGSDGLNFGQIPPGGISLEEEALPDNADEVVYFSRAVRALDRTVAALRLGEGRVQAYRRAIALCRETLTQLQSLQNQINQRLRVVETELAEARQDVSVAKALLAEETARVGRINERRDRILSEHVTFLAYQRPRSVDLFLSTPWRSLDPGFVPDPLPPCLNDNHPIPRELRALTDLLRDAPLSWFTALPQTLDRLDRIDSLVRLFQSAKQRLIPGIAYSTAAAQPITTGSTPISQSINRLYGVRQQQVLQKRLLIEQIDLNSVAAQSWQESRSQAEQVLTLGDLLDGNHRRPEVSNQAATLLDHVTRVATCLYTRFEAVRPALRLDWAERLSQFDEPVNLRLLTNLPRWGEIDYLDRRELQSLVDWLFQQINPRQSEAIAFLSDLVRLSLLLASHAPVNQIIAGRVVRPTTVRPGGRVQITIDPLQVRIGMPMLVYSTLNTVVAQGIVEDLNGGLAAAKITQTTQANLELTESTRVQFLRQSLF